MKLLFLMECIFPWYMLASYSLAGKELDSDELSWRYKGRHAEFSSQKSYSIIQVQSNWGRPKHCTKKWWNPLWQYNINSSSNAASILVCDCWKARSLGTWVPSKMCPIFRFYNPAKPNGLGSNNNELESKTTSMGTTIWKVNFQCLEAIDATQHGTWGEDQHLVLMVKGIEAPQLRARAEWTTKGLCKKEALDWGQIEMCVFNLVGTFSRNCLSNKKWSQFWLLLRIQD